MNTVFLAALLRPFALFLFLSFCLCVRYAVIAWLPESRAKRLLILPLEQVDELTPLEACAVVIIGVLIVASVALLPNLDFVLANW